MYCTISEIQKFFFKILQFISEVEAPIDLAATLQPFFAGTEAFDHTLLQRYHTRCVRDNASIPPWVYRRMGHADQTR